MLQFVLKTFGSNNYHTEGQKLYISKINLRLLTLKKTFTIRFFSKKINKTNN